MKVVPLSTVKSTIAALEAVAFDVPDQPAVAAAVTVTAHGVASTVDEALANARAYCYAVKGEPQWLDAATQAASDQRAKEALSVGIPYDQRLVEAWARQGLDVAQLAADWQGRDPQEWVNVEVKALGYGDGHIVA